MNDACTFSVSKYFGASIKQILRIIFGNFNFLIETTITKLLFGLFQVIKPVPNNYYQIFICWFNYDTAVIFLRIVTYSSLFKLNFLGCSGKTERISSLT